MNNETEIMRENFIAMQQLLYKREKEFYKLKHDLKTPITSIQLMSEFLLNSNSGDVQEQKQQLTLIIECCRQMNHQLESVLWGDKQP